MRVYNRLLLLVDRLSQLLDLSVELGKPATLLSDFPLGNLPQLLRLLLHLDCLSLLFDHLL